MIERDATDGNEWYIIEGFECAPDEVIEQSAKRANALDIGPWELAILESISYGYGQVACKELLGRYAFGIYRDKDLAQATRAIERCFSEGWVQHLTMDFLSKMRQELRAGGYELAKGLIGEVSQTDWTDRCDFEDEFSASNDPVLVGLISFTRAGALLYERWLGRHEESRGTGHWAVRNQRDGIAVVYGESLAAIDEVLSDQNRLIVRQEPIVLIGPWCDCWWRRFPNGHRTKVWYETNNET